MSEITNKPDGSSTITYDLGPDDSFIGFQAKREGPNKSLIEGEVKGANPYDLMAMFRGIAASLESMVNEQEGLGADLPLILRNFRAVCRSVISRMDDIAGPPSENAQMGVGLDWDEAAISLERGSSREH